MKNKLYIITLLLCVFAKAQETKTVPLMSTTQEYISGEIVYYKDSNNILDRYLGDWVYDDGTHYLKITFIKSLHIPCCNNKIYTDELWGKFLYKVNGVTIYDTYGLAPRYIHGSDPITKKEGGLVKIMNTGVSLSYSEPTISGSCDRSRSADLIIEFLGSPSLGSPAQLKWTRINSVMQWGDTVCDDGTQMDSSEFQIPENMILNKQ